jgi:hypothetical protein
MKVVAIAAVAAISLSGCSALGTQETKTTATPIINQGDQFMVGDLTLKFTKMWEAKTVGQGDNPMFEHEAQAGGSSSACMHKTTATNRIPTTQ